MRKRHKHGLSFGNLTTFDMGQLVPVGWWPVLFGDTMQCQGSALLRLLPLNLPVMHTVSVRLHYFFCPYRILDPNWEDFITGGKGNTYANPPPTAASTTTLKDLQDYFGVPRKGDLELLAAPFRAYRKIYNEFYRDQDLIDEIDETDDTDFEVRRIAWEKDRYTAARPSAQKGPDVSVPIAGQAPLTGIGFRGTPDIEAGTLIRETGGIERTTNATRSTSVADQGLKGEEDPNNLGYPNMYADLSNATGADINDVRKAFALQRYGERVYLHGSRYTEYLAYLGVNAGDARLQRPEYLGGGKATLAFSEVLQTTESDTDPQKQVGFYRGHGIGGIRTRRWRRFFPEHGVVLALASVRPKAIYNTVLPREWSRRSKEDYWQAELEFIGQEEIYNREVFATSDATGGSNIFGYQDRYGDYSFIHSQVTSEMRVGQQLDQFHMARDFSVQPVLNQDFIECNPSKRIFAVTSQEDNVLWTNFYHNLQARRFVRKHPRGRVL